jgi:alkylhydroperoxidase family enzyme
MTWLPAVAPGASSLARVFGLCPAAYARFRELDVALWDPAVLDPVLLELCQLRVTALIGGHAEPRGAATAEQVAALPAWPTSPRFGPVARAALAFAERFVLDPHAVIDDDFAALRAHLDAPAIATLVLGIAVFDATARFTAALGVAPESPG